MNFKQFISFIGGFLSTALAYGLLMLVFMAATFSFAGETLSHKENREAFFFYTSLFIVTVTISIVYRQLKTNRKFSALGIAIPLLFAIYILFETGKIYSDNLNYHQAFDHVKWIESDIKPFKMAKTMTKEKVLIGQSKQQIINKLGDKKGGFKNEQVDYLEYLTDKDSWKLILNFKNDKVIETYLYEDGLGI